MPNSLGEGEVKRIRIDESLSDSPILWARKKSVAEPELYDPTIVRISVEYEDEQEWHSASGGLSEKFSVPRHIICSESSVFKERFVQRTTTRIKNVRPWAFRVFVRWLHKGEFYYDRKRFGPNRCIHTASATPSELNISAEGYVTELEDDRIMEKDGVSCDDPVTWPYSRLFELYIFAQEYEVELFRFDIQDIIHIKLIEEHSLPKTAELADVVKKLSDQDTLRYLLAHWFAWTNRNCRVEHIPEAIQEFSVLPSSFIFLSLLLRDARYVADSCPICGQGNTDGKCNVSDLLKDDTMMSYLKPPWSYHHHDAWDKSGKGARCYWRWMSKMHRISTIDFINRDEACGNVNDMVAPA